MSSRPETVIRGLSKGGPRVAGTEDVLRAVGWISDHMEGFGFENEDQKFDCPVWRVQDQPCLSVEGVGELACAPMLGSVSGEVSGRLERHGRMIIWGDKSWPCFRVVDEQRRIFTYVLVRPDGEAAAQPLPPGAYRVPHVVVGASNSPEVEAAALDQKRVAIVLHASAEPSHGRNVRAWVRR